MPIYEYQCTKCGAVFEVFQKISDPPPKTHSCGSRKVRRIMSRSSFVLKGSGWYVTDYARKEKGGRSSREESGESKGGKSDSGKESSTAKTTTSPSESPSAA